jgi:hypothetical protein
MGIRWNASRVRRVRIRQGARTLMKATCTTLALQCNECARVSRVADATNCIMRVPTHVGHWKPTEKYTMANNPNDRSQQGKEGMSRDSSGQRQEGQGKTPQGDRTMSGQQGRTDQQQPARKAPPTDQGSDKNR